uniref:Uncharacterized protein n=1 Tax=Percolomonas cosmopolitus TaxID=63605 RepID=A0A7S1PHI7_9EUKA|mmetsp:Transcript_5629/g.21172  ORF Transcript_5629/g.21172 Transcript_5629/m.21172 type:complete len:845 (+) Transcript_5629:116-2650(+)
MYNPFISTDCTKVHFPDFSKVFLSQRPSDNGAHEDNDQCVNIEESQIFHDLSFNIDMKMSNANMDQEHLREFYSLKRQEDQSALVAESDASREYFQSIGDHLPTYEIQRDIRRQLRAKYERQKQEKDERRRRRIQHQSSEVAHSTPRHARASENPLATPVSGNASPASSHYPHNNHSSVLENFDPNLLQSPPSRIVLYDPSNDQPVVNKEGSHVSRSMQTNLTIAPSMTVKITVVENPHLHHKDQSSHNYPHMQQTPGGGSASQFSPRTATTHHSHDTFNSPSFISGGGDANALSPQFSPAEAQIQVSPPSGLFTSPHQHMKPPTGKSSQSHYVQSPFLSPIQRSAARDKGLSSKRNLSPLSAQMEEITPIKADHITNEASAQHSSHQGTANNIRGQQLFLSPIASKYSGQQPDQLVMNDSPLTPARATGRQGPHRVPNSPMVDVPFLSPIAPAQSSSQAPPQNEESRMSAHMDDSAFTDDADDDGNHGNAPTFVHQHSRQHSKFQPMAMSQHASFLSPVKSHYDSMSGIQEQRDIFEDEPSGFGQYEEDYGDQANQNRHRRVPSADESTDSVARGRSPSFISPVKSSPIPRRRTSRYRAEESEQFITPRTLSRKENARKKSTNADEACRQLDFNPDTERSDREQSSSYHMSSDSILKQQPQYQREMQHHHHSSNVHRSASDGSHTRAPPPSGSHTPTTSRSPSDFSYQPSFISPVKVEQSSARMGRDQRDHTELLHRRSMSPHLDHSDHCPRCGFASPTTSDAHHHHHTSRQGTASISPRSRPQSGMSSRFHPYAESTSSSVAKLPIARANSSALYAISNPIRSPLSPVNYSYIKSKILSPSV